MVVADVSTKSQSFELLAWRSALVESYA